MVDDHVVSLVSCDGYDDESVRTAVRTALDLIGGIDQYLTPGMHVLVKPNLLMGADPAKAVCTHPKVLEAVCQMITDMGCTVTIADSPGAGIPYRPKNLHKAYELAGYSNLHAIPGVSLNTDTSSRAVAFPEGILVKQFEIITPIFEADAVVVISKLKTHIYTGMTGATKNLFGAIPGLDKPPYHARLVDPALFGKMLLDLNRCIKPDLQIMDAIDIMEGDGPMAGTPVRLGAILSSPNYTALDIVASRLIGFDPCTIGGVQAAIEEGCIDEKKIVIIGATIEELANPSIQKPQTHTQTSPSFFRKILRRILHGAGLSFTLRPSLIKKSCIRCMKCRQICPVDAIELSKGYPVFMTKKCICCYCCHEMCDSHAISLKRGILHQILRPFIR